MPKSIDTLVEDIYHLLDEDVDHEPSEDNIEWLGESVKALLRSRLSSRKREAATLRFSKLGLKDRKVWYSVHKPEEAERIHPKTFFKFLYGDMIELLLLFLAKEAGHEVTNEQKEVEIDGVLGHCDAVIDGVTVDAKSASSYSYQKFKDGRFLKDDPFGYIVQLAGYSFALGTERAGFLVADKVHGDILFAEVDAETLAANPPRPRIEHLKRVLQSTEEPEECCGDKPEGKSGNRVLTTEGSYCGYKCYCWREANEGEGLKKYYYSTGPKWFTHFEREPRVSQEIEPF